MMNGTLTFNKSQSRSFAFAVLVLCLLSGIILINLRSAPPVSLDLKNDDLAQLPTTSTLSLRNFHRSESKDGALIWEITAERGEFYPERSQANLIQPSITFFDKEGAPMYLTAPLGEILLQGQTLTEAIVSGGAKIIHSNGTTIEAPQLRYLKESETVVNSLENDQIGNQSVLISNEGFNTSGQLFEFNITTQTTSITGNVKSILTPRVSESKNKN
jgi:LPS export ABC transporter protein LptC